MKPKPNIRATALATPTLLTFMLPTFSWCFSTTDTGSPAWWSWSLSSCDTTRPWETPGREEISGHGPRLVKRLHCYWTTSKTWLPGGGWGGLSSSGSFRRTLNLKTESQRLSWSGWPRPSRWRSWEDRVPVSDVQNPVVAWRCVSHQLLHFAASHRRQEGRVTAAAIPSKIGGEIIKLIIFWKFVHGLRWLTWWCLVWWV